MPSYGIIGAGLSGINAARHALDAGGQVTIFEQTDKIGGTWVYTDETEKDKNGLEVHSSMYQGLRTNLPKETMGFADFPIGDQEDSYVTSEDVLQFIVRYAEKFDLRKLVKFEHHVIRVIPLREGEKWQVLVKDLKTGDYHEHTFDFLLVCNGHHFRPLYPEIEGRRRFKGLQLHSHEYRCPDRFRDKKVVMIGGSHSGMDISIAIAPVAEKTVLSHRCAQPLNIFYDKVIQKPEIIRIYEDEVEYVDGTREKFDVIIHCTGYKIVFPFLSADCGIYVEDNHVRRLFKHIINIRYPTMAIIGLPFSACFTLMVDLQVRFTIAFFSGSRKLPTREEMLTDTAADEEERISKGLMGKFAHMLAGDMQQRYYDALASTADVEPLKPVLTKLYAVSIAEKKEDIMNYRKHKYRIVDDENFIKIE
ncbi:uncharacterized protein LOC129743361 [Uranotaenia lowii]|uniref:uncharacterized protein LOC129743361 n=1 Tax=Uranotaenia lowii TaxID=190385 RepID=UPI0024786B5C|nr:uncharacterized protein LOC129743361 [Uranotaenia lowii]